MFTTLFAAVIAAAAAAAPATAPTAPVEHRLTPDQIAAAEADGAARNRAADLLATTRGDPALALPLEKKKAWHGTAEVAIGSGGYRAVGGEVATDLGDHATATIAGQYGRFDAPRGPR